MLIELTHCVVMLTLCLFNVVMIEYFSYSLLHPCNNLCVTPVWQLLKVYRFSRCMPHSLRSTFK